MAIYKEEIYTVEEALINIGDYFWRKYNYELRIIAETNNSALIKEIHDTWDTQAKCNPFGTDIRIEWAKAIYAHGDWDKACRLQVPDFRDANYESILIDPRLRHPAEFRTDSGIYVRSLSELCIANWLYFNNIRFEYEREVFFRSVRQTAHCDFFLVEQNIYVEYWGMPNQDEYEKYKAWKQKMCAQNAISLIELNHEDLKNLRDSFNKKIRSIEHAD